MAYVNLKESPLLIKDISNELATEKLNHMDKVLSNLITESKIDCNLDMKNLDKEIASAFNITNTIIKWQAKKTDWKKFFSEIDYKLTVAKRNASGYYQYEYSFPPKNNVELSLYVDSDVDVVRYHMLCVKASEIIKFFFYCLYKWYGEDRILVL